MQIEIGKIVNTHGLKGECKIYSSTDFDEERFAVGNQIHVKYNKEDLLLKIATFRKHKGMVLISFEGLQDINCIEKYKGSSIYVNEDELHDLEENEVYFYQLVGCLVKDEEGNELGEITEILETAAHDIIRVKQEGRKDLLIPYVERFIVEEDVEKKVIIVSLIEGML